MKNNGTSNWFFRFFRAGAGKRGRIALVVCAALGAGAAIAFGIAGCNSPLDSFALTPSQKVYIAPSAPASVYAGERLQLTAAVFPQNGSGSTAVVWTSGDESVVTVDENGRASAVGAGTAEIRAALQGRPDVSDVSRITVLPAQGVEISPNPLILREPGETGALQAQVLAAGEDFQSVTWASPDETVAEVRDSGKNAAGYASAQITGAGKGIAVIRAVASKDTTLYGVCPVEVGAVIRCYSDSAEPWLEADVEAGAACLAENALPGHLTALPEPGEEDAPDGLVFTGWNTKLYGKGDAFDETTAVTGSVKIYAQWSSDWYYITYDGNGATGGEPPAGQKKARGLPVALRANSGALEKTGYAFDGWSTSPDGSDAVYAAGAGAEELSAGNKSVTLYARWRLLTPVAAVLREDTGAVEYHLASENGAWGYESAPIAPSPELDALGNAFEGGAFSIRNRSPEKVAFYEVTGAGTAPVILEPGAGAALLFRGAAITASPALDIRNGAAAQVLLSGENTLDASGGSAAAVHVTAGAAVTIDSAESTAQTPHAVSGALTAKGGSAGSAGAGIGGAMSEPGGAITIAGGAVTASGGNGGGTWGAAAGIGGGGDLDAIGSGNGRGSAGTILITGGVVNAAGGTSGAGIGGGAYASNANGVITIEGGTVIARGGASRWGAGIGGGCQGGSGGTITIKGGAVFAWAASGTGDPAAIGGARWGNAGVITITGGVVTAVRGSGGSLGGGNGQSGGEINITGGTVIGNGIIGGGAGGANVPTHITGNAAVLAPALSASGIRGGAAFTGGEVTVTPGAFPEGDITLNADIALPAGAHLTIPPGWTLHRNGHALTGNVTGTVTE